MLNTLVNTICNLLDDRKEDNTPRKTLFNTTSEEWLNHLKEQREIEKQELVNTKPVKIKTSETVFNNKDGTTTTRTRYKYVY